MLRLPKPVLEMILMQLSPRDLCFVAATCRALRQLSSSDAVWRPAWERRELWDGFRKVTPMVVLTRYEHDETLSYKANCLALANSMLPLESAEQL